MRVGSCLRRETVVVLDATEDGEGHELPLLGGGCRSSGYGSGIPWIACDGRAPL